MNISHPIVGLALALCASLASAQQSTAGRSTAGTRTHSNHDLGSSLLCASLLGSGALSGIFTVTPLTPAYRGDPDAAIQFGSIWSTSHQATVDGSTASATPSSASPPVKPAVAIVKLPIVFSDAERQQFEAAGWKARKDANTHGTAYCIERAPGGDPAQKAQGMICILGAT